MAGLCTAAGWKRLRVRVHPVRLLVAVLIALAAAPGTWVRTRVQPENFDLALKFIVVSPPATSIAAGSLGPFTIEGMWRMVSSHSRFGSFSALGALPDGSLLAVSDRGMAYRFAPPGRPAIEPQIERIGNFGNREKPIYDSEALTIDRRTGRIWIAWENTNAISRHARGYRQEAYVTPRAMQDWGRNSGPETMVRLTDGRFLLIREAASDGWLDGSEHRALLYAGDPTRSQRAIAFTFSGPRGFSPTDAAELPDGRVLILMRKVVWPFPARFAGRIVVADPREIRAGGRWPGQIAARLTSSLPVDNFEGMAVAPRADGLIDVWLISDDNQAQFQRSMLWKLRLDPAKLPRRPAG